MKVLRSTLVIGLAAFAAACGDKVTVAGPPTTNTTPTVNSVTVTPAAVTMSVGQTSSFTAAVDVSNGAATTVTWSSSDASKVSVSATGVATAVAATPGVAICATSTVNTSKQGCASVVVSSVTNIPATVSIQSITVNGTAGTTVNPAATAGTIDIRANIAPGTQTVTKVVAMVGTVRADSQTFSATQSAALRYAADLAIQTQSAFPPVLFSINTAKFNATTGIPTWTNGNYNVAVLLYVSGNANAQSTATYQTPLTFANANTYVLTTSASGATATSGAGYTYRAGNITASLIPVIYTPGLSLAAGNLTFGTAGCDATGPRTIALTAPAAGSSAWTATLTNGTAPFVGYEFRTATGACAAVIATGEGFTLTGTDNNGNGLFAAAAAANSAANTYRMDNVAPGVPTLVQNPNNRQNGWINASVAMTGVNTGATSNGWMVNGAADLGVGGYTRLMRVGSSVTTALAATASSTPALPAPSATNATYCGVFSAKDLLGNESALPAAGTACSPVAVASNTALAAQHMLFGVDIAPPTIAFSGGLAASSAGAGITTGTVGGNFQFTVTDTGTVGNSGMLAGAPVIATVTIRSPTAGITGAAAGCIVGTFTGGVCTQSATGMGAPALPLVATATVGGSAVVGYYTVVANSIDAAGNVSGGQVTRVVALDQAANIPALTTSSFSTPISGGTVTFAATASDNFDLWKVGYNLTYGTLTIDGAAPPDSILFPATVINTFNTAPFVNSNVPVSIAISNFVRQMEFVTGNGPLAAAGGQFKPDGIHEIATDMVGNATALVNTAIPAASVTTGTSYLAAAPAQLINSWSLTNVATNVSTGATSPAANALSVTLTAVAAGPTATFNPPFARVDFYAVGAANQLEYLGTTSTYSTVDDGSAQGRRHTYSFSWTPGTKRPVSGAAWTLGATQVFAVGVNASGDALISPSNANITLTNP